MNIPYGRQHIDEDDITAVTNVLRSDFLTQGPIIQEFERTFANYIGSKYAVAVSNGTAALHLSAMALGVEQDDQVIVPTITFSASANCIKYCGGQVVFSDIDPKTFILDFNKVEDYLAKHANKVKGIVVVDFAGYPAELDKLRLLADQYDCWIIEDACHAPGASFINAQGQKTHAGDGHYADLAIFSFHPVKHIACGEGGMITTNDKELYEKLKVLRTHGITKDSAQLSRNDGGWYYELVDLGYNYRLTDFQAALGVSQLKKAAAGIERRNAIARFYDQELGDILSTPYREKTILHAFHLYVIQTEYRKELYEALRAVNIFTQVHYIPIHQMPFYKENCIVNGQLTHAEEYYKRCLSLPMYPSLRNSELDYVVNCIKEVLQSKIA